MGWTESERNSAGGLFKGHLSSCHIHTTTAMMRVWILMMLSAVASGFFTSISNALGHCIQTGVESRTAKINHIMALKNENKEGKNKKKTIKKSSNKVGNRKNVMPPPMRSDNVDKVEKDENLFTFPNFRDCEYVTK